MIALLLLGLVCSLQFVKAEPVSFAARQEAGTPFGSSQTTSSDLEEIDTNFNNVRFIGRELSHFLFIRRVNSERSANNLLIVKVTLKNLSKRTVRLEVQTVYKTDAGIFIDPADASWLPLTIPASSLIDYHSGAVTEQASNYLVRIRRDENESETALTSPGPLLSPEPKPGQPKEPILPLDPNSVLP